MNICAFDGVLIKVQNARCNDKDIASSWFYYKNLSRRTVTWTSKITYSIEVMESEMIKWTLNKIL